MATAPKVCKDCTAQFGAGNEPKREVKYSGPRCTTHYRTFRKQQKATRHENYVARTYSLEPGEYEALYRGQNGLCALCGRANGATRKLSVDHDHGCCSGGVSCGYCVRGLLCRPCNDILGHARDDWKFFARCIRYLLRPPALDILRKKRPDARTQRTNDTRVLGRRDAAALDPTYDPSGEA